jgi:hypothetical protein
LKGLPSATRMQIVRYIYPAENSQGKCDIQVIRNIDTRFLCDKCMFAMVYVYSTKE